MLSQVSVSVGHLDELHGAIAPRVERLDPNRRPPFVEDSVVQIVYEIAVALEQAEAFRVAIGQRRSSWRAAD